MKYLFVFLMLGLMVSCAETKYYKNGNLKWQLSNSEGDKYWFKNGQLKSERPVKIKGKYNGVWREWYENGHLFYEDNYIDGKLDGLQRQWYENGQLWFERNYKDGEKISQNFWTENGELID